VRDGQTSPHRPRPVVSRSTCPPLSPSPNAHSFIIGTVVINTHTEFMRMAFFFLFIIDKPLKSVWSTCVTLTTKTKTEGAIKEAISLYVVVPVGGKQRRGFRNSDHARADGRVESEKLPSTVTAKLRAKKDPPLVTSGLWGLKPSEPASE
jgi:hypothetical protein